MLLVLALGGRVARLGGLCLEGGSQLTLMMLALGERLEGSLWGPCPEGGSPLMLMMLAFRGCVLKEGRS